MLSPPKIVKKESRKKTFFLTIPLAITIKSSLSVCVIISLSIIVLWILLPLFTLLSFLIVASYHFGKEDCCVGNIIKIKFENLLYFLKGSLVVIAPLTFHTNETLEIFKILNFERRRNN